MLHQVEVEKGSKRTLKAHCIDEAKDFLGAGWEAWQACN
jgi:hypothetical protein